jgi:hypothetical protein
MLQRLVARMVAFSPTKGSAVSTCCERGEIVPAPRPQQTVLFQFNIVHLLPRCPHCCPPFLSSQ